MAIKIGTTIQYVVFGLLAYILAGAPFYSTLFGSESAQERSHQLVDRSESLVIPEKDLDCPGHAYKVHMFSQDPLVLYIENFLSESEVDHVVRMSEPKFTPSTIWSNGVEQLDPSVRKSEKALLDRDSVVKCVEDRARSFQGWQPNIFIERLWSQRYLPSGHYRHHYDWSSSSTSSGRVSSFMVYLGANCTGGGTNFPRLKRPDGEAWCRFIDCGEEGGDGVEGVTFEPIKGNAVFWINLRPDGSGYRESWHAGLPVRSGTKIGLNIWSWRQDE